MIAFVEIIKKLISGKKKVNRPVWGKILEMVADILLIVISVSIALLVEGWVEKNREHKRLDQYYTSFVSEANEDLTSLQDVQKDAKTHIDNCKRNLKILMQENPQYDSVTYYLQRMFSSSLFANSQMVSYKSMLSSGDMHLMENLEMRKALVELDESYFSIKIEEDMYLKYITDDLTDFVSTNFDMITWDPLNKNFYKETKFKNLVVLFLGLNQARLGKYEDSEKQVKATIDMLQKEIRE